MEYEIHEMKFKRGESVFFVLGSFILVGILLPLIPLLPSDLPPIKGGFKRLILTELFIAIAAIVYLAIYLKLRSIYKLSEDRLSIKRPFYTFTIKYDEIRNYYWDRGSSLRIEKLLIELIGDPHDPYEINWNRIQKEDQKHFMRILSIGVKAAKTKNVANQAPQTTSASARV